MAGETLGMSNFELAQLALGGVAGAAGAYSANQNTKQNKEQLAMQRRLEAMRNQQNLDMQLLNRNDNQARDFSNANPLGAEQKYATRQATLASILPGLKASAQNMGGPTDPAIASTFQSPTSPLAGMDLSRIMQTLSPDATARAITDRRMATSALDPTAAQNFRPLTDYGLDPTGAFNAETEQRTTELLAEEGAAEGALREMAKAQLGLTEEAAQRLEQSGGSSIWKKLAKVGIIAGGAALMATGVGGPAGAALIGAGMGAGNAALDGAGWKGILGSAALGGVTGGVGGGAASSVKSAILNPRTIAQMAGAGIGGKVGAGISLGSNFLPGASAAPKPGASVGTNAQVTPPLGYGQASGVPNNAQGLLNSAKPLANNLQGFPGAVQPNQVRPPAPTASNGPRMPVAPPQGAPAGGQVYGRPAGPYGPAGYPAAPQGGYQGPPQIQGGGGPGASMRAPNLQERIMNNPVLQSILSGAGALGAPMPTGVEPSQQPFARVMGSPVGMLATGAAGIGGAAALKNQSNFQQLLRRAKDLQFFDGSPSGKMAVDDLTKQLGDMLQANPSLYNAWLRSVHGGK
jgi:hypothetical protein